MQIIDSYPLSPVQHGMLIHSLSAPQSGVYVQQLVAVLREELNVSAFRQAWERIVSHHPILRTSFSWDGADEPLQRVHANVSLPFECHDWSRFPVERREELLESFLQSDRERGFSFDAAPLMRQTLFRYAEAEYRWIWTSHHALLDGRSRLLLLRGLFAVYEEILGGRPTNLNGAQSYRNYIDWLNKNDFAVAEGFWRDLLSGFTAPTPLPSERNRPAENSSRTFGKQTLRLSGQVTRRLQSLAREHRLTPNTFLQGAWALLLSRYSGEADVVFGATRAGRHSPVQGVESMVGLLINTVPVRASVSWERRLLPWLQGLRNQWIAMRDFEHTPLVKLQGWSNVPRGMPLFENILVFENYLLDSALRAQGGAWENRWFRLLEQTNYPLTLAGYLEPEFLLEIAYDRGRFNDATIARMLDHVKTLLEGMAENPDRCLSDLPFVTEAERHQLLVEWNDTGRNYPTNKCIHQLVEAQVEQTPDSTAVVFHDRRMTYRELNHKANEIAVSLVERGIGKGSYVPFLMDRSIEVLISMLAIMKTGAAFVPLDINWPSERTKQILDDLDSGIILVNKTTPHDEEALGRFFFLVDEKESSAAPAVNLNIPSDPANPIYAIYTSGSTGKPKAAVVPHRGITNRFLWMDEFFGRDVAAAALQTTHHVYDSAVWQLFWPLINGGKTVIPTPGMETDADYLAGLIENNEVTITDFVPSVFNTIVPQLVNESVRERLRSLRTIIVGGEEITPSTTYTFMAQFPSVRVINLYGPTEASIGCVCYEVTGKESGKIPIGRPISNVHTLILDTNKNLVPSGVAGELYLSGICLGLGYLNDEEKTQAAFVDNPFPEIGYHKLYKTGDLVRYLPDGKIEFLGRLDHQVKIRGFRIELGEIEYALRGHPAIREAIVLAREDDPGGKRLVAYVVLDQEPTPTPSELRRFLKQKLLDYMLPSAFVMLDALPLTPNGKVDRQALPASSQTRSELEETFVAPRSPTEEILAGIWAEVLKLDQVGIHDNFFDLGGHSLLATQVISRLRVALRMELPLRFLFEYPTVAGLTEWIEETRRQEQGLQSCPIQDIQSIQSVSRANDLPLSFAQQRLWFLDQYEPGSSVYNIPSATRLTGALDVSALEQSLQEIVNRHEALRTTFSMVEGQAVQVIAPSLKLALPVVDLSETPEAERAEEAQRLAQEEARRPFDLSRGPLFRARLLQLGKEDHVLLMTLHHIVSDGWSMGVMYHELSVLYQAFSNSQPSPLPDLPIQYADYAVWQREWLTGEELERQISYWKKQLEGIPPLQLPTDRPRPPVQTHRGARQSLSLSQELTEKLKSLSRREGVTLYMTLLAAFQTLLHRYSGQDDIVVGSPIAGRNRSEIEGLIGFFINSLVMRTNVSGDPSFKQLLSHVREVSLGAYAHQDIPFENLLEELRPERDLSRSPLFQVFFNVVNVGGSHLNLYGLKCEAFSTADIGSKFDLTIYVSEQGEAIQLDLVYNADLFEPARMAEMLRQLNHLLCQVVENPEQRIRDISLVTASAAKYLPDPTQPLRSEWNGSVHTRFSEQARSFPNCAAIVSEREVWTYQELDSHSSQLANYLLANGIQSQDVVAIYGHRSASLVWALLGILKAGGAFLILDPAYPASRLIDCLKVAKPRGWIQVDAAGAVPDALDEFIAASSFRCRVELPRLSTVVSRDPLSGYAADDPGVVVGPEDLAYVAFTSGTEGKPKAVLGTHRPLSHFLQWHCQTFALRETYRFSLLSGLSHDPLLRDIFTPLWLGATLYIPDSNDISPTRLMDWMNRSEISVVHLTPAMGQLLSEIRTSETAIDHNSVVLPSLRYAFFAADALSTRDVFGLQNLAPSAACVNFYGATETPQAMGYFVVPGLRLSAPRPDLDASSKVLPLGRGIEDVQLLVLNHSHQLAGIGELGEIYIRTPYLVGGYLGDSVLTRARFLANPFTGVAGDRLYKTGDLGRYLADGNVEFAGRADNQVNIRGFRIEPGEVEAVLSQHPALKEIVVVAREDEPGDKRLVGYVVARQQPPPTSSDLRAFSQHKLPDYMVPSAFVFLDSLPLTPNGKIDRRSLPAPDGNRDELEQAYVAPRSPTEEILAGIWAEVLKLDPVGIHDNFFELGGHSLLATQVISRVREAFQMDLPLRSIFEKPTVEELTMVIMEKLSERGGGEEVARIMAELESLSDEEARRLIAEESGKLNRGERRD